MPEPSLFCYCWYSRSKKGVQIRRLAHLSMQKFTETS